MKTLKEKGEKKEKKKKTHPDRRVQKCLTRFVFTHSSKSDGKKCVKGDNWVNIADNMADKRKKREK